MHRLEDDELAFGQGYAGFPNIFAVKGMNAEEHGFGEGRFGGEVCNDACSVGVVGVGGDPIGSSRNGMAS